MIERLISRKILQLSGKFPVVAITGPRQSGKTTLIKSLFPNHKYISLEEPEMRLLAESDPKGFFKNAGEKMIIDEAQRVPNVFSYIQSIVDNSNRNGRIIISGSQSFLLNEKISQSLAGRVAMFCLLPLSIQELLNVKHKIKDIDSAIFKGFYPRMYKEKIKPSDFYPNYTQTYIERDVRLLKNIGNLSGFINFMKLCAGRAGQLLNLSAIANDAGISVNTVKSWLSVLEASYIIYLLQPYYKNFNKRIIKMPKLMFYDTGLLCSLLGIKDEKQLSLFYMKGNLFENLIISEFLKKNYNAGIRPELYFWRDSKGNEIDLLFEINNKIITAEIKQSSTINPDFTKNIEHFRKLSNTTGKSYIIYGGDENYASEKFNFISWRNVNTYNY